jgi:hypothetical protein
MEQTRDVRKRLNATVDALRRLATFEGGEDTPVVSAYLDLSQPEEATPRSRVAEIESLADRARQTYTDTEQHRQEGHQPPLRREVERVREFLEQELAPLGAAAVAVFSCLDPELFEVIRLPRGVEPKIVADRHAILRPLLEAGPWLSRATVVVANRDAFRLFRLRGLGLREVDRRLEDRVDPDHRTSEGAHQHRIERWAQEQAHEVAAAVRGEPVAPVVLVAPAELLPTLEGALAEAQAGPIVGRIPSDATARGGDDLLPDVERALEEHVAAQDRELLDDLGTGLGPAGTAVRGDEETLQALYERRVAALVLVRGRALRGVECPECGWMATEGTRCPVDGEETRAISDLTEPMIRSALGQSADVRSLEAEMLGAASSAALLRFAG